MKTLQVQYNNMDEATPLRPLQPRSQLVREKKLETLQMMLRKIEEYRDNRVLGFSFCFFRF